MLMPTLTVLAAYLLGSLSFAIIVTRVMGLSDPRTYGSGNAGATNVLRSGSKKAALATLALDALKGWLPVVLIKWFGADWGLGAGSMALAGLAAFVGHLYPVFFGFRGGKGVATALGVLLGFEPLLGLATLVIWGVIVAVSRYVSLASIGAALSVSTLYLMGAERLWTLHAPVLWVVMAMGLLVVWRHRENIRRLLAGTESRLERKKS